MLRNSYLHDNENGLLTGANATSEITIDHCEFARNGGGEGSTHNLYVGAVGQADRDEAATCITRSSATTSRAARRSPC